MLGRTVEVTMNSLEPRTESLPVAPSLRPSDEELDLFGITHVGRVRKENQDHFLVCTVNPQVVVHGTSLPNIEALPLRGTRLATIMIVADGVGGSEAGSAAAQLATTSVMRYAALTLRSYHAAGTANEGELLRALATAAMEAHDSVRAEAAAIDPKRRMATTLTVGVAVYPWFYAVQVGDSRCYFYHNGELRQVTRDQTIAQQLVDDGVLSREDLKSSPFNNVLSSAIGGDEATPELTRVDISQRGCVLLMCSDGLTKHVSDDEIGEHLGRMTSSQQVCRALLELALERGGTDNITIMVGRAPMKEP